MAAPQSADSHLGAPDCPCAHHDRRRLDPHAGLDLLYWLPHPRGGGHDLFSVMFSGAYGCMTYAVKGRVEIIAAMVMLIGASIGARIGVTAVKYIRGYGIRLLFAIMVLLAGISVLSKQLKFNNAS